jgi:uncharacterized protein (TIGR00730 family)
VSDTPAEDAAGRDTPGRVPLTPDEELLGARLPTVRNELTDPERVAHATLELGRGFDALRGVTRAVSVFGSARTPPDHPEYALARETARRLGEEGFAIITGGGPGVMEAANRGAQEAGVASVGLNIVLPFEQEPNPYQDIGLEFDFFFTRKVMFVRYASAFVVFPGGYGTLDEMFEALLLIQTMKIEDFPVLLVGADFWGDLVTWMRERLVTGGFVSAQDLELFRVTDDVEEIVDVVRLASDRQFGTAAGSG